MNEKTEEIVTSDFINPTMLASENFDAILDQVKASCLNFQIQVSPFSAMISLKKSLIKDKTGQLLLPPNRRVVVPSDNMTVLNEKNIKLEKDVNVLTKMHEEVAKDCEKAKEIIKSLKKTLLESEIKAEEIESLKNELNDRDNEIVDLKIANKNALEVSARLNKDLNDYKLKISAEKAAINKEHREEVKALKKSLGEANKGMVAMQKQFEKKLSEEVAEKEAEIRKVCNEKIELEEKVHNLLDSLYGCNHCGRQECALECEEYEEFLKAENAANENAYYERADYENAGQDAEEQSEL